MSGRISEIPNKNAYYKDTLKKGGIVIEGWDLGTNDDGYVAAPPHLADQMKAHGFVLDPSYLGPRQAAQQPKR